MELTQNDFLLIFDDMIVHFHKAYICLEVRHTFDFIQHYTQAFRIGSCLISAGFLKDFGVLEKIALDVYSQAQESIMERISDVILKQPYDIRSLAGDLRSTYFKKK